MSVLSKSRLVRFGRDLAALRNTLGLVLWVLLHIALSSEGTIAQTLHTTDGVVLDVSSVHWIETANIQNDSMSNRADAESRPSNALRSTGAGWEFQTESGRRISAPNLIRWGSWPGILKEPAVWLSDGSWLCGDVRFERPDVLSVSSDWFERVPIAISSLRGAILHPSASHEEWTKLQSDMISAGGADDHVWIKSGSGKLERLRGILRINTNGGPELGGGGLGSGGSGERGSEDGGARKPRSVLSKEPFTFSLEVGEKVVELSADEIVAIVTSPTLQPKLTDSDAADVIGLRDGSSLRVREVYSKNGVMHLETQSGLSLVSIDSPGRFCEEIRHLRRWPSNVTFVNELQLAQYRHVPVGTSLTWELGVDRDSLGRPLVVDSSRNRKLESGGELLPPHRAMGQVRKGLGMHSDSRAAYRWDGSEGEFFAEVVFAPAQQGADPELGSVVCRLLAAKDGKLVTLASLPLNRSGAGVESIGRIQADVTGAQLIVLVTESADFGQLGDHVLWLDARICEP